MFNWTTTTIVNELPEKFIEKNTEKESVRIGKHLFEKRWVESIRIARGHEHTLCKATLNLETIKSKLTANVARLYIYIGLDGSEESIYANDLYRKGMPLSVSFAVSDDATTMAKAIADTVKQFNVFTKVKKVLNVTASGNNLILEGTHEHQRFQKITFLIEDETSDFGEEKVVLEYERNRKENVNGITIDKRGTNGFGTYSQLIKDLRLPTMANTNWLSTNKNEMPIVGAVYDQYIITYYAPSLSNPSFTSVGNRSMSETTHVFWVNTSAKTTDERGVETTVSAEWEKALNTIDPDSSGLTTITNSFVEGVYSNKSESLIDSENFDETIDETTQD